MRAAPKAPLPPALGTCVPRGLRFRSRRFGSRPRFGHGAAGCGGSAGPAEAEEVGTEAVPRGSGRGLDEILATPQREGAAHPRTQAEGGGRTGVPVDGAGVEAAGEVVSRRRRGGGRRRPAQVLQGEVRGQEAAVGLQLQRQALPEGLQAEALPAAGSAQAARQHQGLAGGGALGAAQPQQPQQRSQHGRRRAGAGPHRGAAARRRGGCGRSLKLSGRCAAVRSRRGAVSRRRGGRGSAITAEAAETFPWPFRDGSAGGSRSADLRSLPFLSPSAFRASVARSCESPGTASSALPLLRAAAGTERRRPASPRPSAAIRTPPPSGVSAAARSPPPPFMGFVRAAPIPGAAPPPPTAPPLGPGRELTACVRRRRAAPAPGSPTVLDGEGRGAVRWGWKGSGPSASRAAERGDAAGPRPLILNPRLGSGFRCHLVVLFLFVSPPFCLRFYFFFSLEGVLVRAQP